MAIMNRVTITAVHDTDLRKVLIKLGLYKRILKGEYKCFICGKPISLENLGAYSRVKTTGYT